MAEILSTYRLQLHREFPLARATELVDYLTSLGVTHVHASPIFAARPGSTHGYDVTDPLQVNPELGGEEALITLAEALRARGMGLVLDIVPNHMAAARENWRWEDVLRLGGASPYSAWFDIDWRAGEADARDRVVLPVLGDVRVRVLERGEIRLVLEQGEFRIAYYEHSFPVDPATLPQVLGRAARDAAEKLGEDHPDVRTLEAVTEAFWRMPRRTSRAQRSADQRAELAAEGGRRLSELCSTSPVIRGVLEAAADEFTRGDEGRQRLRRLLDQQPYRLVFWRRAAREINYRRFFDINELVGLHIENPEVFRAHHARVLEWRAGGLVDGYRIDHPDGLLDPAGYFDRLADAGFEWQPDGRYPIWAEKILGHGERLPAGWPIAGTTGYDFLNQVEAALLDPAGNERLQRHYHRIIRRPLDFAGIARLSKRLLLETSLAAAVRRSAERRQRLARGAGRADDAALPALMRAITETIVYLPVYRTYVDSRRPLPEGDDRAILERTLTDTRERGRAAPGALDLIADALLGTDPRMRDGPQEQLRLRFVERLQQLTGPAAAKGIEDTALYRYVPLLSRNEVGGDPGVDIANAVDALHEANLHRARHWPRAMLVVTTHDTKRSADVRARLDVLSEVPDEWEAHQYRWRRRARGYKQQVGDRLVPDTNTAWLFFQTLVGIWPMAPLPGRGELPDDAVIAELRERICSYMLKAIREAKTFTSWLEPDEEYEAAVRAYAEAVLDTKRSADLLHDVSRFVACVARPGLWNALSRTVLQLTSPGIPDIYQGDELWNFSMVDPDNRRPVAWPLRRELLESVIGQPDAADLVRSPEDGRIKLLLHRRLLCLRRERPELFTAADYTPVRADGACARH
ncbi:MAG: malto-oligosyltrehalose synthase, partial [Gemmatimonadota bacterium]|nr:malto-oligosyltrehalose synthase [Gemmatimonadota bacterium]